MSAAAPAENPGKAWKGLVASLIFSGAGQFLSGHQRRGITWAAVFFLGPTLLVILYNQPFVPARSWLFGFGAMLVLWTVMLFDSYRPVKRLRWSLCAVLFLASLLITEGTTRALRHLYHAYRVPTSAMLPTLGPGDHLLAAKKAYTFREPERGDLVVFTTEGISLVPRSEDEPAALFIKRVVGLPGDRLAIIEGRVWVNGEARTFGNPTAPIEYRNMGTWLLSQGTTSYVVPPASYFMLGDNSANSYDSRYWGPVRREAILGRVTKIYWPWKRMCTPR